VLFELAAATVSTTPELFSVENAIALLTLTALEIVLGIDNVVFIAILCGKLPEHQRAKARQTGLALALVTRIMLLTVLTYIISLAKTDLFTIPWFTERVEGPDEKMITQPLGISGKDLILIIGGFFLIAKATLEIHHKIEDHPDAAKKTKVHGFWPIILQILLIDIVFSLDSVITAVGMAQSIWVMIVAVMISIGIMLAFAGRITRFIDKHPTMKMLALAFLLLIGVVLVADGLGRHIEKGYIYFAMAFSLGVESLNLLAKRKTPAPAH
jgi:predicted tellurium resistance membrane protein TerC